MSLTSCMAMSAWMRSNPGGGDFRIQNGRRPSLRCNAMLCIFLFIRSRMTVLSVSIVFTVVEPVFLIRQSAKCANRAVLCRPVIVRPPHFPPKRPGHALGATLGRHEERQHPRPAGRHRFTRVQEARFLWRFGDRMEGADRAGHLQLDLVLLVDPARVLPLIQ